MSMILILEWVVGIVLIGGAIVCVTTENILAAIVRLSLLSMVAVVAFALMRAPDVALTEAVIGSGLVTFVFVVTVKELFSKEDKNEEVH
jgi:uncharacterized MnhB-related membrane protein